MSTIVVDRQSVHIPEPFEDLEAFRTWARSEDYPDAARVCYLNGELWVDMSKEQFTHNQIKAEVTAVLAPLVKREFGGRFSPDGYLLSSPRANLSTNPDGIYVSERCLRSSQVEFVEGAEGGLVELQGTPDMVLEIISPSSVEKDTIRLPNLYWRAGIPEYWLIDPQAETVEFTVFHRTAKGYQRQRKTAGWVKSSIFGRSFRLSQQADALGYPEYTLAVR